MDDIVRLAAHVCAAPMALVSLCDEDGVRIPWRVGLPNDALPPAEHTFAHHALDLGKPLVVPDARDDLRFANHPLVAGSPHARMCAATPLVGADGYAVGALVVLDTKPRVLTADQVEALAALGRQAVILLGPEGMGADARYRLEHYSALMEHSSDMITILSADGVILSRSPSAERILGYHAGELVGRGIHEFIHPEDGAIVGEFHREIISQPGVSRPCQFRFRRKDGSWRWLEAVANNLLDRVDLPAIVVNTRDITDRLRAEEDLREARDMLQALFMASPLAIMAIDLQGRITLWNPACERVFGWTAAEAIGRINPIVGDVHIQEYAELRQRALSSDTPVVAELSRHTKNGQAVDILLSTARMCDANGSVRGVMAVLADITEPKRTERALQKQARQQAAVADLAQRALSSESPASLIQDAADVLMQTVEVDCCGILEILPDGVSAVPLAGCGWDLPPEGHNPLPIQTGTLLAEVLAGGKPVVLDDLLRDDRYADARMLREHGLCSGLAVAIPGPARPYGLLMGFTRQQRAYSVDDVQHAQAIAHVVASAIQRMRAEEAMFASEQRLERIIQQAPYPVLAVSPEGMVVVANQAYADLVGLASADAIVGKYNVFEDTEMMNDLDIGDSINRVFQGETVVLPEFTFTLEHIAEKYTGWRSSEITLEITMFPVYAPSGQVAQLVAIIKDITEARRAHAALRESEERFRALIENATDLIAVLDANGVIVSESPSSERILGFKPEEMVGQSAVDMIHPEDLPEASQVFTRVAASPGVSEPVILRCRHRDGSWRYLEVLGNNLLHQPGIQGIVINARDVTERKRLEDQLVQAQKMESVGRLAGGIAHDFNNLLTAIMGYSQLAAAAMSSDSRAAGYLANVMQASERAANLTRQLLAFARKQVIAPTTVNLNELILNLGDMLQRLIGEDIRLVTRPAPDLGLVRVDPGQIEQVLVNLAVNARDAMPDGGELMICTENVRVRGDGLAEHPQVAPGDYARIVFSDTGAGIEPSVIGRIFEPFFTTKEAGKGTGLGLATCYGIIKQSGGYIWVESKPGKGTTFEILLRRVDEAPETERAPVRDSVPAGTETILLVEDEPLVRGIAVQALRAQGYAVIEAAGGEEALRLAENVQGRINLVVTDVVMPGMGGRELSERLCATYPRLRGLFISGYTDGAITPANGLPDGWAFLQKPFAPGALVRKVRGLLDERPACNG